MIIIFIILVNSHLVHNHLRDVVFLVGGSEQQGRHGGEFAQEATTSKAWIICIPAIIDSSEMSPL